LPPFIQDGEVVVVTKVTHTVRCRILALTFRNVERYKDSPSYKVVSTMHDLIHFSFCLEPSVFKWTAFKLLSVQGAFCEIVFALRSKGKNKILVSLFLLNTAK